MDLVKIVSYVVMINLGLSALKAGLEVIKDKTATELDNKAYAVVNVLASIGAKVVDMMSANVAHKPEVKKIA